MRHEQPKTDDARILTDAIKDNLSPKAAAAMGCFLLDVRLPIGDDDVWRELNWLAEEIIAVLSESEFTRLCDEMGL